MFRLKTRMFYGLFFVFSLGFSSLLSAAIDMRPIEFWNDSEEESLINLNHSSFKEILQKYVLSDHSSGIARFNYGAVTQSDFLKLQEYLEYLQLMEPRQLTTAEAKAYWINLYNAATLQLVLQVVVDKNISKIRSGGLPARRWRQNILTISRQKMSLEDIMHGVIRPMYKDPRVHYALFFCALGGPDMPVEVFDGDNNEQLLSSLEAKYLQHSRAVRVESQNLVLSEMFKFFDTDFAPTQAALLEYLKQRVPDSVGQAMSNVREIRYEYDLTVNAP